MNKAIKIQKLIFLFSFDYLALNLMYDDWIIDSN